MLYCYRLQFGKVRNPISKYNSKSQNEVCHIRNAMLTSSLRMNAIKRWQLVPNTVSYTIKPPAPTI